MGTSYKAVEGFGEGFRVGEIDRGRREEGR